MRAETLALVRSTLKKANNPLTIDEITTLSGVSRNSVRSALVRLEAISDGNYPSRWIGNQSSKPASIAGHKKRTVAVPLDIGGDWITRWETARQRVGATLATTEISRDSDPNKLFELFADAAKVFASIAYALKENKDKPDWYQSLGGSVETLFEED